MSIFDALNKASQTTPQKTPNNEPAKIAGQYLLRAARTDLGLITNRHAGAQSAEWKLGRLNTGMALLAAASLLLGLYGIIHIEIKDVI